MDAEAVTEVPSVFDGRVGPKEARHDYSTTITAAGSALASR
jgi:hypothetical protein